MQNIVQDIARNRTQLMLFPGLYKLKIHSSSFFVENSTLFLHRELANVDIALSNTGAESNGKLLDMIADRTGGISVFTLYCHNKDAPSFEKGMVDVLRNQSNLISVKLPRDAITTPVLSALSSLNLLKCTQLSYCRCRFCLLDFISSCIQDSLHRLLSDSTNLQVNSISAYENSTDFYL